MPAAWIGAAAAVAGTVGSLTAGGSSGGVPNAPNFSDFGQANSQYGSDLSGLQGYANQGNQFVNNITQSPYGGGYQAAAGNAAQMYGALAPQAQAASSSLYGAGNTALGAGNAILQAGFDPQQALFNQTFNQQQQQTGAQLAATGVGSTPYGASVMGQNNSNFDMNWQNNQLQREATAASAYGGLNSTAIGDYQGGATQGAIGAQAALQQGAIPYDTSLQINQNSLGALSSGQGLYSTSAQNAGNYLNLVNGGYSNALGGQQQAYNQNQAMYAGLGNSLGSLYGLYQNGSYGTGSQIGTGQNQATNYSYPSLSVDSQSADLGY